MDYKEQRLLRTGYSLTKEEIEKLTPEEKKSRKKQMLDSRDEIRRIKELDNL